MGLIGNASIAYVHYLSFMLCFGALIFERVSIKADPNKEEAISMLLGLMQAPLNKLAGTLNEVPSQLVRTINAVSHTKS